jgi:hypothetical protein
MSSMPHNRRCWEEDALTAVSVALYLYLAFGAVQAWAHVGGPPGASAIRHPAAIIYAVPPRPPAETR